jgi:hypothetical protein
MPHEAWRVKDISKIISTAQNIGLTPRETVKAIIFYKRWSRRLLVIGKVLKQILGRDFNWRIIKKS